MVCRKLCVASEVDCSSTWTFFFRYLRNLTKVEFRWVGGSLDLDNRASPTTGPSILFCTFVLGEVNEHRIQFYSSG